MSSWDGNGDLGQMIPVLGWTGLEWQNTAKTLFSFKLEKTYFIMKEPIDKDKMHILFDSVLNVLAPVEASQVISQLSGELSVELVQVVPHQVPIQLQNQVLSDRIEPGRGDGGHSASTHGYESCQMPILLCGVVQLVGVDKNQVGFLHTLKLYT